MTSSADRIAAPALRIPLLAVLLLALAVSTTFAVGHRDRSQKTYAVAASAHATLYGSGTALRDLLF